MKKTIIKLSVFILTFVLSLIIIGRIMNTGNNNMTMEIASATLPVITMETDSIAYNQLHGYREAMDVAFQRESVTQLSSSREVTFIVDTYGQIINGVSIEVRSTDGNRLVESTPVTDLTAQGELLKAKITLKDLIDPETEYALVILLDMGETEPIRYYTRIISSDNLYCVEKLEFAQYFHDTLYNREAAQELTRYLESNAQGDNSSYHKVTIHSSFQQVTWGELDVREETEPIMWISELAAQTASIHMQYLVSTLEEQTRVYYTVHEFYRIRYTADRIYLLDFERTMTQIPDSQGSLLGNDKILLGIIDPANVPFVESEDGSIVLFQAANRLCSYNVTNNKLVVLFSFYDKDNGDARTFYSNHDIRVLDVDEGGNVRFAVCGYMNRGRHEGEIGIQIYYYDSALNTVEEAVYIPYSKSYSVLREEMDQLLYLNRENTLYLFLENTVYEIHLEDNTYEKITTIDQDNSMQVSENHKILVWQEGEDIYHSTALVVKNLNNGKEKRIQVGDQEAIMPLGFMGEDIIYGVAHRDMIVTDNTGRITFPMYKVEICNSEGEQLKQYQQDEVYVTDCKVEENQITLEQVIQTSSGSYQETVSGHITQNIQITEGKNKLVVVDTERYKKYVQIQVSKTIDTKAVKIITPKEVVFEGGRELLLEKEDIISRYYIYGSDGVEGIYNNPASAVNLAYDISGTVTDESGATIWRRGNLATRNQIMAIKEQNVEEGKTSLSVCLDTILKLEGIVRDTQASLDQGNTVTQILEDSLEKAQILDLTGCSLNAVLYYVNKDIPVMAMLENGEAVLIVGFNEFNIVIMEPATGTLYKKGMNDSSQWFEENGNNFVTYMRK